LALRPEVGQKCDLSATQAQVSKFDQTLLAVVDAPEKLLWVIASSARLRQLSRWGKTRQGFVTLPRREREVSAAQDLLGRRDCRPPRVHRRGAKHAVRLS
jgi:hypothetical protein